MPIRTAVNPVDVAVSDTRRAIDSGAQGRDRGWAYKCMIEWAYEVVRLKEAMDAQSRLHSLFVFDDLDDAVSFAEIEHRRAVFAGEPTNQHARRSRHDFGLYYVRNDDLNVNSTSYFDAWSEACAMASRYWSGEVAVGPVETLLDGAVELTSEPVWVAPN